MRGHGRRWYRFFLPRTGRRGEAAEPRSRRLRLEPLEDRRLLTVFGFEEKLYGHGLDIEGAYVGTSVAIDGDYAVVGASQGFTGPLRSGAAHVYLRNDQGTPGDASDDTWEYQDTLGAHDAAAADGFGRSISISGDTIVVGAPYHDGAGRASGTGYVFMRSGTSWSQQQKLMASDAEAYDYFGRSVSISGDTVVVGADWDDDAGKHSGSAYVFTRVEGAWTQQQKLTASDAAAEDEFGSSVSVWGETIVVGAIEDDDQGSNSGSAYVFARSGTTWTEQQKLTDSDGDEGDVFGYSVSIEGDTIAIGAPGDDEADPNAGSVCVFTRNGTLWTQQQKLTAANPSHVNCLGHSVSISGDTIVAGSPYTDWANDSGSAHVFTRTATEPWFEVQKLTLADADEEDHFGSSVSVSGDTIVVGVPGDDDFGTRSGVACAFGRDAGVWWESPSKLITSRFGPYSPLYAEFGTSVASDGDYLVVGAPNRSIDGTWGYGEAYVFVRNDNGTPARADDHWDYQATLRAPDAKYHLRFGCSVAISGDTIVIGVYRDYASYGYHYQGGVAYVFTRSGSNWSQQQKLTPRSFPEDNSFGREVAIRGDTIVVGDSGSAYVYARTGTNWDEQQKLVAPDRPGLGGFGRSVAIGADSIVVGGSDSAYVFTPNGTHYAYRQRLSPLDPQSSDKFAHSVSISGETILIGAPWYEGADIYSGAAYLFTRTGDLWIQQQRLEAADAAIGDNFGSSVSIRGDMIVVGAPKDDHPNGQNAGSVYVFTRSGSMWSQQEKLTAPDAAANDYFGYAVATTGSTIVAGASEDDDGGATSGSAYAFSTTPLDYGDAPAPYPVLWAEGGARHVPVGPTLGAQRDAEDDGTHSDQADSDDTQDTDDEDGVTFGLPLTAGQDDVSVTVNVEGAPDGARLDAWIDFNADGCWAGQLEQIAAGLDVADGDNVVTFDVPSWAVGGETFARFRLSTAGGLGPDGLAPDGEVEDYAVSIVPGSGEIRGVKWEDLDADGQRDPGEPGLSGWIIFLDANANGQWDPGERAATTAADDPATPEDEAGTYAFPGLAADQFTVAEILLPGWGQTCPHPGTGPPATAHATPHVVALDPGQTVDQVDFGNRRLDDLGDAPYDGAGPDYPTLLAQDGARHVLREGFYLGRGVDAEEDGQPDAAAFGDDQAGNDDEDGVDWRTPLVPHATAQIIVTASAAGRLDAWIDFDADGVWEASENVFDDRALEAGENWLDVAVPYSASVGTTFARFRFSSAGGLEPTGPAADGEVEDYQVEIVAAGEIGGVVWDDLDGNGRRDPGEPGLAGWWVFLDTDGDGQLDPDEPRTMTLTDAPNASPSRTGEYRFTGLVPGVYAVAEVLPPDWMQTLPWLDPEIEHVSVPADGTQADEDSYSLSISADGRYVAFNSYASNLVPDDTNGCADLFVRDRQTGVLERVSLAADGTELNGGCFGPSISADGRYVAFYSVASNLVPGDNNDASDVFTHDRWTGITERASVADDGTEGNSESYSASISADGRYLAFRSYASNLVPGDTNDTSDIFVCDRQTGTVERVSVGDDGTEGNDRSDSPSISADGRYVAFVSEAWNFVPDDTTERDVFVYDRQLGKIELVSAVHDGTRANDESGRPSISPDGRYVAFESTASNLVPGDTNGVEDVFVRDRWTGTTERASVAVDGSEGNDASYSPSLSADGRYLSFCSDASNLVPGDTNSKRDLFLLDRQTGALDRVRVSYGAGTKDRSSTHPSISADGRFVAFASCGAVWTDDTRDILVTGTMAAGPATGHAVVVLPGETVNQVDFANMPWCDFGDAPDPYPTRLPDGARHWVTAGGPFLGQAVDPERDGQPDNAAMGDDLDGTDDEDGVTFTTLLAPGDPSAGVDVDMRASPVGGVLNAWIDFNGDGDWADAEEQIFTDEPLTEGLVNSLTFPVPAEAKNGRMFARFRVSTETGLSFDGPASDGEVEDYLVYVVRDLGPLDFRLLSDEDPTMGSLWYRLETVRHGYLTVEASLTAGSEGPLLILYDGDFSPIASGSRIDRQVASGETYLVELSSTTPGVDLRISNLLQHSGTAVTVHGTGDADQFEFDASASRRVAVNGVRYEFDDDQADTFAFQGGEGDDAIVLDGSEAADALELWPGSGTLVNDDRDGTSENDFRVELSGVETVTADGNGGSDVALLHDDPATTDWFKAWPQFAVFSGSRFSDRVLGFEEVYATATPANRDVALLFDSNGDDECHAGPGSPQGTVISGTTLGGRSFFNSVDGFYYVHAYANAGGSDAAYLYDNPAATDWLKVWPHCSILSGDGFYDRVLGFEVVHATATPGQRDVAQLYDGDGDDTFHGGPSSPEGTVFSGTTLAGRSFVNSVDGFHYVHAYSRAGGSDVAYLYDNPAATDWLRAWPQCAILSGAGLYDRVLGFEQVHATATPGQHDVALLYDSDADDTFYGGPGSPQGTLFMGTTLAGQSFANSVDGFGYVHAYSRNGGIDQAYLFDSPANDRFGAWSQMARIYGAGFYCRALDFEQGSAIAIERDDDDEARAYQPTPWQAVGDWEGGNMTPSPLPPASVHPTRLEQAWAAWAAVDETEEDGSEDSERNLQGIDPAPVDWLMAKAGN